MPKRKALAKALAGHGFRYEDCVQALADCADNITVAAAALIAKFGRPKGAIRECDQGFARATGLLTTPLPCPLLRTAALGGAGSGAAKSEKQDSDPQVSGGARRREVLALRDIARARARVSPPLSRPPPQTGSQRPRARACPCACACARPGPGPRARAGPSPRAGPRGRRRTAHVARSRRGRRAGLLLVVVVGSSAHFRGPRADRVPQRERGQAQDAVPQPGGVRPRHG